MWKKFIIGVIIGAAVGFLIGEIIVAQIPEKTKKTDKVQAYIYDMGGDIYECVYPFS